MQPRKIEELFKHIKPVGQYVMIKLIDNYIDIGVVVDIDKCSNILPGDIVLLVPGAIAVEKSIEKSIDEIVNYNGSDPLNGIKYAFVHIDNICGVISAKINSKILDESRTDRGNDI